MLQKSLLTLGAVLVLSGCQTSAYMSSAAQDGEGITCNKIYQAFDAYDRDRESASAWAELGQLINPVTSSYADMTAETAARYYDRIKAATNLSLSMKGCAPVR